MGSIMVCVCFRFLIFGENVQFHAKRKATDANAHRFASGFFRSRFFFRLFRLAQADTCLCRGPPSRRPPARVRAEQLKALSGALDRELCLCALCALEGVSASPPPLPYAADNNVRACTHTHSGTHMQPCCVLHCKRMCPGRHLAHADAHDRAIDCPFRT